MAVQYMAALTERYDQLGYTPYRWFHADGPPPLSRFTKRLADARVGVLSTSGAYRVGQIGFSYKDDTSIRAIPKDTATEQIHFAHFTENYLVDARKDPNCLVPVKALRAIEAEGAIGELAPELLTCMGGIYSQRRVHEELAPALEARFRAQAVDAVLLIPM